MSKRNFGSGNSISSSLSSFDLRMQRGWIIGIILFVALIAFEIFNFDTTQFALESLLGDIKFLGFQWAAILAIAFCAIDFAGLNRLFSPEGGRESREVWYLMGAWLLGATMNAVMTWWAVSVTLLNNNLGNEVLSREQLLRYVPIFVAVLVWLTRILFIGSLSIAGVHLFNSNHKTPRRPQTRTPQNNTGSPVKAAPRRQAAPTRINSAPKQTQQVVPEPPMMTTPAPVPRQTPQPQSRPSRVRQRPPIPNSGMSQNNSRIQASRRR
jgi:hypothetical protein